MTVTAIRRTFRAQALEQVLNDPTLAKVGFSSLAKRWGVSRSTARGWMKNGLPLDVPSPVSPVAVAMAAAPMVVAPPDGRLANFTAYGAAGALAARPSLSRDCEGNASRLSEAFAEMTVFEVLQTKCAHREHFQF